MMEKGPAETGPAPERKAMNKPPAATAAATRYFKTAPPEKSNRSLITLTAPGRQIKSTGSQRPSLRRIAFDAAGLIIAMRRH